jgi:hypothetical protein
MKRRILGMLVLALALMVCLTRVSKAAPMGTAWTYQGRLMDQNEPADGEYDFQFKLFDDPNVVLGNQLGSDVNVPDLDVIDGYFTVLLDFGSDVFDGNAVWLETGVRPGDFNAPCEYTVLAPRQEVTPTPYALMVRAPLHLTGSSPDPIIKGTNTDVSGKGVYGEASYSIGINYGGYFVAKGGNGRGVLGEANGAAGVGVRGKTSGSVGRGVYGSATDSNGTNYGGYFVANGDNGRGALGWANGSNGVGVRGKASGSEGRGVYSSATDSGNVENYGGYFEADGKKGIGVYGEATNTGSNYKYGGYFMANGDFGRGVYGQADGSNGVGVRGKASGSEGKGVYGTATDNNGTNYGGYFKAEGSSGRGVHAEAHGSNAVGVHGRTNGSEGRAVYGYAYNQGDVENYGGYFVAYGRYGKGVYAKATGWQGKGVYGEATGSLSKGVCGISTDGTGVYGYSENGWAGHFKGDVKISDDSDNSTIELKGSTGTISTEVLEITGGSDLSEGFDIRSMEVRAKPGMLASIDPDNPGRLIVSSKAYDRTVAGIISGAGGIKSGMVMGQRGTLANGQYPVALTGRVYCLADAAYGSIQAGDLLTTSDTPGHAMKVTDRERSYGTVIGKAMSSLKEGKGLVLVLVNLQ